MSLLQRLPPNIRKAIADQIKKAVAIAARHFKANVANERSLTGALVIKLEEEIGGTEGDWEWSAKAVTLSEQPEDVGEGALGADFVVQIDVYEKGRGNTAQKIVPIQGKNRWRGDGPGLPDQLPKLAGFPGGGLVADYRPGSFVAVRADAALEAEGLRSQVEKDDFRDLGDALGEDFLECRVGTEDAYVSTDNGEIVFTGPLREKPRVQLLSDHVLRLQATNSKPPAAGGD